MKYIKHYEIIYAPIIVSFHSNVLNIKRKSTRNKRAKKSIKYCKYFFPTK